MDESGKLHTGHADEKTKVHAKWSQLMTTQGEFDLVKFQLLLFTGLIALYVVYWLLMHGSFPKLDANWLLLMGISNWVYLGNKMVGPSEIDKVKAIRNKRKDVDDRIKDLNDSKNQANVELAAAELDLKAAAGNADKEKELQEAITKIKSRIDKIDSDIECKRKKMSY